jgi:hypothetical protein
MFNDNDVTKRLWSGKFVYTSPVAFSTPAPASQLPPPKKMRTAFRKRECARISKVGEKGEGGWNKWPGQNIT